MIIQTDAWHYRVYCWFKKREPSYANLCPYVRTVFIWAPLKFLFVGWVWKIPFAALFWPPLLFELPRWVGMVSYNAKEFIYAVYVFLASVAGAIAVSALLVWIFSKEGLGFGAATIKVVAYPFRAAAKTSTWEVLKAYIKAAHDKICPIVRFTKEPQ